MLKSCQYCNRIHDSKHICIQKQASITLRQKKFKYTTKDSFRNTQAWQHKREEIRQRDSNLCQICIRKLYDTLNQYTYNDLSVHHAVSLQDDYNKRLDNDNLLTLCDFHHERAESGQIAYKSINEIIIEQESKQC